MHEVEQLYKAVEITILAQEAAARAVEDGITECEVQASLEYMFTGSCARPAFPSIVATGKNGTILHYNVNKDTLKNGQLVVVDIGAEFGYYCADITEPIRFPAPLLSVNVNYMISCLQRKSILHQLHNRAIGFRIKIIQKNHYTIWQKSILDERGYGKYFIHGIGHFLGIDVHDVGD